MTTVAAIIGILVLIRLVANVSRIARNSDVATAHLFELRRLAALHDQRETAVWLPPASRRDLGGKP